SRIAWRLTPQVAMERTKPDFLLQCEAVNIHDIAIYTDGRAFHASSAVNRLADDAAKRAWVRSRGNLVVAVTNADVESASVETHRPETAGGADLPDWFSRQVVSTVLNRPEFGWTAQSEEALGNPIDVLVGLIQAVTSSEPDIPKSMTAAGDGAPLFFAVQPQGRRVISLPASSELADAVVSDVAGSAPLPDHPAGETPEGHRRGFLSRRGALIVVVVPVDRSMSRFDTAVVLDDRSAAMADAEAFAEAWKEWLHLSNIMPVRFPGTRVELATVSSVLADRGQQPEPTDLVRAGVKGGVDIVQVTDGGAPLSAEGAELLYQPEMLPEEAECASALAASGVINVPEWGFETDEGISLDFAWPEQRIAVLFEPDDDDTAELEDNGWILVSATVDTVTSMLVERG